MQRARKSSSNELIKAHFGDRLRELRLNAHGTPSIRQLAKTIGISPSRLSRLERSVTPDLHVSTLLRIQAALGTPTLEEFFGSQPSKAWAARAAGERRQAGSTARRMPATDAP